MNQINNLHNVYLGLGSNIGDRKGTINAAIQDINNKIGLVIKISSLYESEPVGFSSDNLFINGVCLVQTKLSPLEVLESCQAIERELGRKTKSLNKIYSDRTIDIDILLYDNDIVEYPSLIIPHPHLHNRNFVLQPLSEIAPQLIHPLLNKTIDELKTELTNNSL